MKDKHEYLILGNQKIKLQFFTEINLWVPVHLFSELNPWIPFLLKLPKLSDDIWIISSIKSGLTGGLRYGTSHVTQGAIDLAPIFSFAQPTNTDATSPLLFNNRLFCQLLLKEVVPIFPFAIFVEQDHLHIGMSNDPGVYLYRDYTKYSGDKELHSADPGPVNDQLHSDGSLSSVGVGTSVRLSYRSNDLYKHLIL
jgi:hypothetical protein